MEEKDQASAEWLSPLVLDEGFSVQFRDDHVHIELGKDFKIDPKKRDTLWKLIAAACQRHNTHRVLVEGFLPSGEQETSDVVDAGQKTASVPRLWLAFAVSGFQPSEQTELYVAIASSKGVRVKFFAERERALLWLRNNAPA